MMTDTMGLRNVAKRALDNLFARVAGVEPPVGREELPADTVVSVRWLVTTETGREFYIYAPSAQKAEALIPHSARVQNGPGVVTGMLEPVGRVVKVARTGHVLADGHIVIEETQGRVVDERKAPGA